MFALPLSQHLSKAASQSTGGSAKLVTDKIKLKIMMMINNKYLIFFKENMSNSVGLYST